MWYAEADKVDESFTFTSDTIIADEGYWPQYTDDCGGQELSECDEEHNEAVQTCGDIEFVDFNHTDCSWSCDCAAMGKPTYPEFEDSCGGENYVKEWNKNCTGECKDEAVCREGQAHSGWVSVVVQPYQRLHPVDGGPITKSTTKPGIVGTLNMAVTATGSSYQSEKGYEYMKPNVTYTQFCLRTAHCQYVGGLPQWQFGTACSHSDYMWYAEADKVDESFTFTSDTIIANKGYWPSGTDDCCGPGLSQCDEAYNEAVQACGGIEFVDFDYADCSWSCDCAAMGKPTYQEFEDSCGGENYVKEWSKNCTGECQNKAIYKELNFGPSCSTP